MNRLTPIGPEQQEMWGKLADTVAGVHRSQLFRAPEPYIIRLPQGALAAIRSPKEFFVFLRQLESQLRLDSIKSFLRQSRIQV